MEVCSIRSPTAGREQQSGIEFILEYRASLHMPPKKRRREGSRLAVKEEQGELSASATVTVCNKLLLSLME